MDASQTVSDLKESAESGDRVKLTLTNGKYISGVVKKEGMGFVVEINSGVIIDWSVMDNGEVFESRWNDDPLSDKEVSDNQIGLLKEFTVD